MLGMPLGMEISGLAHTSSQVRVVGFQSMRCNPVGWLPGRPDSSWL